MPDLVMINTGCASASGAESFVAVKSGSAGASVESEHNSIGVTTGTGTVSFPS